MKALTLNFCFDKERGMQIEHFKSGRMAFVGAGNMAEAIIRGLLAAGVMQPDQMEASDVIESRRRYIQDTYRIDVCTQSRDMVRRADWVLLAVKPQVAPAVLAEIGPELESKPLISIVAGLTISAIKDRVAPSCRIIRTMPNTPLTVGEGMICLAPDAASLPDDVQCAQAVFQTVGRTLVVDESAMDAVTGLSGSGPAYAFLIIEALADGGVRMGLSRQTAQILAAQTLLGAARMCLDLPLHPAQLRDQVTSPAGTTIAGLHQLETAGVRAALINAVEAATRRSRELGNISR